MSKLVATVALVASLALAAALVVVPIASVGASPRPAAAQPPARVLAQDISTTQSDLNAFTAELKSEVDEEDAASFPATFSDQASFLLAPLNAEQAALLSTSFNGKLRAVAAIDALVITKVIWLMGLSWESAANHKMSTWELDLQEYLKLYDAATAKVSADLG